MEGTRAERYLRYIGAEAPFSRSLRYAPLVYCPALGDRYPVLLARVVDPLNPQALEALYRTWLDPNGDGPLNVGTNGRFYGDTPNGVVVLDPLDGPALLVAQRLDNALAAGAVLGVPAIAAITVHRMIELRLPRHIQQVVIAIHRTGRIDAPFELKRRLERVGVRVSIVLPPERRESWIDAARARP